jgi:ankyrin repeat protein
MIHSNRQTDGDDFWPSIESFLKKRSEMKYRRKRASTIPAQLTTPIESEGFQIIHRASESGNVELLAQLIQSGADIEAKDPLWGNSPLFRAVLTNKHHTAQLLLLAKANIESFNIHGVGPLYQACATAKTFSLKMVKLLISFNANIKATSDMGQRPIHAAALNGCTKVVKLLLHHQANPHHLTNSGVSCVYIAAEHGHVGILRLLHKAGVNINIQTTEGITPCMRAAYKNQLQSVKVLVEQLGADTELCAMKKRAYEWAKQEGHLNVINYLATVMSELQSANNQSQNDSSDHGQTLMSLQLRINRVAQKSNQSVTLDNFQEALLSLNVLSQQDIDNIMKQLTTESWVEMWHQVIQVFSPVKTLKSQTEPPKQPTKDDVLTNLKLKSDIKAEPDLESIQDSQIKIIMKQYFPELIVGIQIVMKQALLRLVHNHNLQKYDLLWDENVPHPMMTKRQEKPMIVRHKLLYYLINQVLKLTQSAKSGLCVPVFQQRMIDNNWAMVHTFWKNVETSFFNDMDRSTLSMKVHENENNGHCLDYGFGYIVPSLKTERIPLVLPASIKNASIIPIGQGEHGTVSVVHWTPQVLSSTTKAGQYACKKPLTIKNRAILEHEIIIWKSIPRHVHILPLEGILVSPQGEVFQVDGFLTKHYPLGSLERLKLFCLHESDLLLGLQGLAWGLLHLHSLNIVHGDIASRNVITSCDKYFMWCDFSMSSFGQRRLTTTDPFHWRNLSPEILKARLIATGHTFPASNNSTTPNQESLPNQESYLDFANDIWAFGILMWELANAQEVYHHQSRELQEEVIQCGIVNGTIQVPFDKTCMQYPALAGALIACLQYDPTKRPNAAELMILLGYRGDGQDLISP